MQVLNISINEDGSVNQFTPDFKITRGSYRNVLLNMKVPHSLLLNPVTDTETGENQTGNNARIAAIIRTVTGHNLQTKRYNFQRVKDYQYNGQWFRLYQRRMPKEFTMWETVNLLEAINSGILEMIINVVNWTKNPTTGRRIEEVAASPIFTLDIYPSAFLENAEEIEEPSNFDELHSQVQEMDAEIEEIQSDLYGSTENNLGNYLIDRLKAGNKIIIEQDISSAPNGKLKLSVEPFRANEIGIDSILDLNADNVQSALDELSQRSDSVLVKTVTGESKGLVDNSDPLNPVIMHDDTKADQSEIEEEIRNVNEAISQEIQTRTQQVNALNEEQQEQDNNISALNTRVEALNGAILYIADIDVPTRDITQQLLTDRAAEVGYTTLKRGYTIVDSDANDWVYNDEKNEWVDIGYYEIVIATEENPGLVKSSSADLEIKVKPDGKMNTNNLETKLNDRYTKTEADAAFVKKVEGKELSANDFTDTLKAKLEGLKNFDSSDIDDELTRLNTAKQDKLVSGVNIKTINQQSLLGAGNIEIVGGGGSGGGISQAEMEEYVTNIIISYLGYNPLLTGTVKYLPPEFCEKVMAGTYTLN